MAKTTKTFEVTLRVRGDSLDEIMKLVVRDHTLVACREVPVSGVTDGPAPKVMRFEGGVRHKGVTAEYLLLSLLEGGPAKLEELKPHFAERKFAENSLPSAISRAKKARYIAESGDGGGLVLMGPGSERLAAVRAAVS